MDRFEFSELEHNSPEHIRILAESMKFGRLVADHMLDAPDSTDRAISSLITAERWVPRPNAFDRVGDWG